MVTRKLNKQEFAHRLLTFGDDEACRKYFKENDIDFDLPNEQGCTLLITACAFDRCTLVPEIIHKTMNINAHTYSNGNNLLHFAALSTHPNIMNVVLETDSMKVKHLINQGNKNGDTPLMVASTGKYIKGVSALLEHGADITLVNKNDISAIMCAVRTNSLDELSQSESILKMLLFAMKPVERSHLNHVNMSGSTALHFAIQSQNNNAVSQLIQAGSDVSIRNKDGQTPLDMANSIPNIDSNLKHLLQEAWTVLETEVEKRRNELLALQTEVPTQVVGKKKKKKKSTGVKLGSQLELKDIASVIDETVYEPNDEYSNVVDAMYQSFPLFKDMEITVKNFLLQDLSELSMSQLELIQAAHMQAFQVLNDKKIEVARRLEAARVEAEYELEQQILKLR